MKIQILPHWFKKIGLEIIGQSLQHYAMHSRKKELFNLISSDV